eukprot:1302656-Alexandrium_andersonii.AAC.1
MDRLEQSTPQLKGPRSTAAHTAFDRCARGTARRVDQRQLTRQGPRLLLQGRSKGMHCRVGPHL